MNLRETLDKASALGIDLGWTTPKPVLIRAIQRREGKSPCCGKDERYTCENFGCPWRTDCLALIAEWMR